MVLTQSAIRAASLASHRAPGIVQANGETKAIYDAAAALARRGEFEAARRTCDCGLTKQPTDFSLLLLAGILALQSRQTLQAVDLFGRALVANPRSAVALRYRGDAFLDLQRYEEAIDSYDRALSVRNDDTTAYVNRGLSLWRLGQPRTALVDFERAIEIDSINAEAYNCRGHVLREMADFAAAVLSYDVAIALQPGYAEAHNGRGTALAAQLNLTAALASFEKAIAAQGSLAEAHVNRGNVLEKLGRADDAMASYRRAVGRNPGLAEAHYRLGELLRHRGLLEESLDAYDKAVALNRQLMLLLGMRCYVSLQLCDWRNLESDLSALTADIEQGVPSCPPLAALTFSNSAALQYRAAEVFMTSQYPPQSPSPLRRLAKRRDRIKIGYFSPDLREHPVAHLTAGIFESHDTKEFEIAALSLSPPVDDPMSRRLKATVEHFIEVPDRSDCSVVELARNLQLDVAVDLCGFTAGCRPRIFAKRVAPLQISYIGYLGTMAAPYMDYIIADATLVPPGARRHYAEKIIYLPCYQTSDSRRQIATGESSAYGLPHADFVFCCFNNSSKITPVTFSSWMRILTRVPGSVLFLHATHARVPLNLKTEAAARNVDPNRLIFGPTLPRPDYLARYKVVDLFLDTAPYNAGATASDALWAGVPVLTLIGETFAGRMAASLLYSAGVPELVTSSQAEYEALAVQLALDPNRLRQMKERLTADRLEHSLLFDTSRFTRTLESAYRAIHERYQLGLPPTDLDVAARSAG